MKKKISFLSLCVASSLIAILAFASCKDQNGGGSQEDGTKEFEISELKFWGRNILGKEKITLDGNDSPKSLIVTMGNCDEYDVTVSMKGKSQTAKASGGYAEVLFEDIESDQMLLVKFSASGFKTKTERVSVKISEAAASDLVVKFGQTTMSQGQPFNTTESSVKITFTTKTSKMTKVSVDSKDATLAEDGKSATYDLAITGTDTNPQTVSVDVEFKYLSKATLTYTVKKYANESDLPLELVSAQILSGDDDSHKQDLKFTNGKASVEVADARYSTVKLVMEFDKDLTGVEVKKCTDQRGADYATQFFTATALSGTFSGYVTHDVDFTKDYEETALKRFEGKKYTEVLILGYGTVSYEIEVTGGSNKKATYTVEITNPAETLSADGQNLNTDKFMKKGFQVANGHSGWGTFYGFQDQLNGFFLPFYYKGPNWANGKFNPAGFTDPAYMESFSVILIDKAATEPFYFYYNVMNDEGGKPKNEGKFKRIKALQAKAGGYLAFTGVKDLNDKYLDCFMSGKETLPNPMYTFLYDKKWRKTSTKHGWMLELQNKQQSQWEGQKFPSGNAFAWIFNYRVQAMTYDKNQALTISKKQDFEYWETGAKEGGETNGWVPFLSAGTAENKDIFQLTPTFSKPADVIKTVKCTITKGSDNTCGEACAEYTDVELKAATGAQGETVYKIGCKANETEPSFEFKENYYKIVVEVEYKDTAAGKDTFTYILNYTDTASKIELMDIADAEDVDASLFGVPTSYGAVKMLDADSIREIANMRGLLRTAM